MTINNATVEQINVALLDMDKRVKALNIDNDAIKSLQNSIKTIKSSLNETKAGLTSGATYNINISGNASTATHAATATTAEIVNVAESAGEANHAKVADNISAGGTSGQVLTSNGPSAAPSWQNQKFIDENTLKSIMKPNYVTGKLPGGWYSTGQTVSVSASITTTRGNPVFISYSGDFNFMTSGNNSPWIAFELFVDGQKVQSTTVDNSVAAASNNTSFAGNALAVLSAGKHTIRLDAVLFRDVSGQIQFQEQDNLVTLVAFEL